MTDHLSHAGFGRVRRKCGLATDDDIAWQVLFRSLEQRGAGLHAEIRRHLVQAIEGHQLAPGTRLPSSRRLATMLRVARTTVIEVCQQLIAEGYLESRERSGVFVARLGVSPGQAAVPALPADRWDRHFAVRPAGFNHISKPRDWQRYPYPFLFGQLDPALFPVAQWREAARDIASTAAIQSWMADMIDEDDPGLIDQLCRQVLPRRAVWATPAEVMITLGAQQALYLINRLLLGPGTVAGIEEPGYPDLRHMSRMHAGSIQLLAVDDEGAVADDAMARCGVIVLTPGHQCPTSAVMPPQRRRDVLRLARERDIIVVEDDYDADLVAEGEASPPLKSLDTDGRVIYVGSLSKAFAPGLRLGFVVAPPPVIRELRALRRLILRHPPANNQRAMAAFIALGHYRGHLRRTADTLAERARLIDRFLPLHLGGCSWRRGAGASSVWVTGPNGLEARKLTETAREQGVLIEPGDVFFSDAARGRSSFRLGFTAIRTDRIEEGLRRLGQILAKS